MKTIIISVLALIIAVLIYIFVSAYNEPYLYQKKDGLFVIIGCDKQPASVRCSLLSCEKILFEKTDIPSGLRAVRYIHKTNISNMQNVKVHFVQYRNDKGIDDYYAYCIVKSGTVVQFGVISKEEFGSTRLYRTENSGDT